jgi:hypothetical protein
MRSCINFRFLGTFLVILIAGIGPWSPALREQKLLFLAALTICALGILLVQLVAALKKPESIAYFKRLLNLPCFWVSCAATVCFIFCTAVAMKATTGH